MKIITPVLGVITAAFALSAFAAEPKVEAPVTKLALFKNGVAAVVREIKPPAEKEFIVDETIVPIHGTVWFGAADFSNLLLRTALRERERENVNPYANPVNSYLGKKVVVTIRSGENLVPLRGVVTRLTDARKKRSFGTDYIQGNPYYGNYNPNPVYPSGSVTSEGRDIIPESGYLTLKQDDGKLISIPVNQLVTVETDGVNSKIPVEREVFLFQVKDGKKLTSPLSMSYLTKGITWSPSYRFALEKDNKMRIFMASTLTNELDDFENVEISLISGFPNVKFANVTSMLARGMTLKEFFSMISASDNSYSDSGYGAITQQRMVLHNAAPVDSPDYNVASQGDAEDIQYFQAGRFSMKSGETLYVPLDDAETDYERIVSWKVPDCRDNWGRSDRGNSNQVNPYGDLWDAIRFKNPFRTAMTTAPAEIDQDGRLLGQTMSEWTNPGQEATLKITKALTVSGKIIENESPSNRPKVSIYGRNFMNPDVTGSVILHNYRKVPATVVVKLRFSGEFISAEGSPSVRAVADSGRGLSVNKLNELSWELKLAPGEERKLDYKYSVLVYY